MATSRTAKIDAEIIKAEAKLTEQQNRLKELRQKRTEVENLEIVEIVRGMSIPLDQLAAALQSIKGGTSGQLVPKSAPPTKKETEDTTE